MASLYKKELCGSVLIEACLVIPVLLLLFFGSVSFFCIFYTKIEFAIAGNNGARVMMNTGDIEQAKTSIDSIFDYLPVSIATAAKANKIVEKRTVTDINGDTRQQFYAKFSVAKSTVLLLGDPSGVFASFDDPISYTYTVLLN